MALKQSFETFDGTGFTSYAATWRMQTFTTTSAYTTTDVALYGWKFGTPGNITVSIKAVDGSSKPTGADLCSVTVSSSVVSTLPSIGWYTFTFDTAYALSDATEYAIVVRTATGDTSNYYAPFGYGSSGYAGGGSALSSNSGSTWGAVSSTNDMNFRVYGGTPVPSKPTTPAPANTATGIKLDQATLGWADGGDTDTFEIYFRVQGDSWVLVGAAQAELTWTIPFPTLGYSTTYEWRVDATNAYATTTGDTWSFSTILMLTMSPTYYYTAGGYYYRLLVVNGNFSTPPPGGVEDTDYVIVGNPNFLSTSRILIAAANNKIWFEDI